MPISIKPLYPSEHRHCAQCGAALHPRLPDTVRAPPDQEPIIPTGRRILSRTRTRYGTILIYTLAPLRDSEWGYDGIFCTRLCGYLFGVRSYRAGHILPLNQRPPRNQGAPRGTP